MNHEQTPDSRSQGGASQILSAYIPPQSIVLSGIESGQQLVVYVYVIINQPNGEPGKIEIVPSGTPGENGQGSQSGSSPNVLPDSPALAQVDRSMLQSIVKQILEPAKITVSRPKTSAAIPTTFTEWKLTLQINVL